MEPKDRTAEGLISCIVVSGKPATPMKAPAEDVPTLLYLRDPKHAAEPFREECLIAGDGSQVPQSIRTPWVLFLEPDECPDKSQIEAIARHCGSGAETPVCINVERFLPEKVMAGFSWVTTEKTLKHASKDLRRYRTRELRVVPTALLNDLHISAALESDAGFVLSLSEETASVSADLFVSRIVPPSADKEKVPADRDIFRHGHQKYFNDVVYSERFRWPHTVYHTIRRDHISSVIEALKMGLSNPDVILFTLIYLTRFRLFSEAEEIVALIPQHWFARNPDLVSSVATIHFFSGRHEQALSLYRGLLESSPDLDWIAQNAVKLCVLTENYDAIDEIFARYQQATEKTLHDEYYDSFKATHGKAPDRTATLSVCLIVRDEEKTIEQAIASIKPMADEIIVIDASSSDRTIEIAQSLGAKVYDLTWSDDFSAARNYAISKATGDYIFMIDGDEHISPFFLTESLTLKKLFPLDHALAFKVNIGTYFNDTDWLFITQEQGNFRSENAAVRIFPRIAGVAYDYRIAESVEPSLAGLDIAVREIPAQFFQILHNHGERRERVARKAGIYDMLVDPTEEAILSAIKDFSFLGRNEDVVKWLKRFYERHEGVETRIRMGLHLAKMLENSDTIQADALYRQLTASFPESMNILNAHATYLITHDRMEEICNLPFDMTKITFKGTQQEEVEFNSLTSLYHFEKETGKKPWRS